MICYYYVKILWIKSMYMFEYMCNEMLYVSTFKQNEKENQEPV